MDKQFYFNFADVVGFDFLCDCGTRTVVKVDGVKDTNFFKCGNCSHRLFPETGPQLVKEIFDVVRSAKHAADKNVLVPVIRLVLKTDE